MFCYSNVRTVGSAVVVDKIICIYMAALCMPGKASHKVSPMHVFLSNCALYSN